MPPAARVTDMHTCPMFTGPVPHVGGPILPPGAPTVLIDFLPAATVTNMCTCVGPPDVIVKGSTGVFINFLPAARMGDQTAHGGVIILGAPNVLIGEIGSPSPGAGGMGGVMQGLVASGVATPQTPVASVYSTPGKAGSGPSTPQKAASPHAATAAAAVVPAAAAAPFPCKSAWADTVAHTNSVADMKDPILRNQKISADYAQMFQKDPDLKWAGLGAIVSTQAGCGMKSAQTLMDEKEQIMKSEQDAAAYGGDPGGDFVTPTQYAAASQAQSALADANQLIYRTVSPTMSFVQQHGAKQMQSCLKSGDIATADPLADKSVPNDKVDNSKVPPQLSKAVDSLASGDPGKASDQIADYEQRNVVQGRIYDNTANKVVFGANQFMSNHMGAVGRALGAQPNTIPLSADCTADGHLPFNGSILQSGDRVNYYKQLMDGFTGKGSAWQNSTMQQIISQGK